MRRKTTDVRPARRRRGKIKPAKGAAVVGSSQEKTAANEDPDASISGRWNSCVWHVVRRPRLSFCVKKERTRGRYTATAADPTIMTVRFLIPFRSGGVVEIFLRFFERHAQPVPFYKSAFMKMHRATKAPKLPVGRGSNFGH